MAWLDTTAGAQAWKVSPNSPAAASGYSARATIWSRSTGLPVRNQVQVTKRLMRAGALDASSL